MASNVAVYGMEHMYTVYLFCFKPETVRLYFIHVHVDACCEKKKGVPNL